MASSSGSTEASAPPASLLQLAEILGAANWQPERLDLRGILATLLAEVPPARLQPPAVAATLRDSNTWAALPGLADSWFEDDQGVARIARKSSRAALEKQADDLLRTVILRSAREVGGTVRVDCGSGCAKEAMTSRGRNFPSLPTRLRRDTT